LKGLYSKPKYGLVSLSISSEPYIDDIFILMPMPMLCISIFIIPATKERLP